MDLGDGRLVPSEIAASFSPDAERSTRRGGGGGGSLRLAPGFPCLRLTARGGVPLLRPRSQRPPPSFPCNRRFFPGTDSPRARIGPVTSVGLLLAAAVAGSVGARSNTSQDHPHEGRSTASACAPLPAMSLDGPIGLPSLPSRPPLSPTTTRAFPLRRARQRFPVAATVRSSVFPRRQPHDSPGDGARDPRAPTIRRGGSPAISCTEGCEVAQRLGPASRSPDLRATASQHRRSASVPTPAPPAALAGLVVLSRAPCPGLAPARSPSPVLRRPEGTASRCRCNSRSMRPACCVDLRDHG